MSVVSINERANSIALQALSNLVDLWRTPDVGPSLTQTPTSSTSQSRPDCFTGGPAHAHMGKSYRGIMKAQAPLAHFRVYTRDSHNYHSPANLGATCKAVWNQRYPVPDSGCMRKGADPLVGAAIVAVSLGERPEWLSVRECSLSRHDKAKGNRPPFTHTATHWRCRTRTRPELLNPHGGSVNKNQPDSQSVLNAGSGDVASSAGEFRRTVPQFMGRELSKPEPAKTRQPCIQNTLAEIQTSSLGLNDDSGGYKSLYTVDK